MFSALKLFLIISGSAAQIFQVQMDPETKEETQRAAVSSQVVQETTLQGRKKKS